MRNIYVQMEGLQEIEKALGMTRDKSKLALRSAINTLAKRTEKDEVNEASKRYRFRDGKSYIRESNDITKATTSRLSAAINMRGPRNELLAMHVSPQTYFPGSVGAPEWIKGRVLRSSKLENLARRPGGTGDQYKGFVVRYPAGSSGEHFAVAARVPGQMMRSKHKEAIRSMMTISTPKAEEKVYKLEIENEMYDRMAEAIGEQIDRYLTKGANG